MKTVALSTRAFQLLISVSVSILFYIYVQSALYNLVHEDCFEYLYRHGEDT